MNNLSTIVYCSSNRERPDFEQRIRDNILKTCGGLPIVSVSQKPIGFGKNICVGDVGVSGFNFFRQMQMACEMATTKYVISAEADCLYPPDYFTFVPPEDDICYRNTNTYLVPDQREFFFYKKEGGTWVQIINREFYLKRLDFLFKDAPQWSVEEKNFPKERLRRQDIFEVEEIEFFKTENPCISFKTHRGMRYYSHSERIPIYDLPYWGEGKKVREYFMHGRGQL